MKSMILLAAVLGTNAWAGMKLDADCKKGIVHGLALRHYSSPGAMTVIKRIKGGCDGVTCNPDGLRLHIEALDARGEDVELLVDADMPSRGDTWCLVTNVKEAH